ncbi:hypothetical protein JCM31598_19950 [Desulfonatronum parangueonense]
MLTATKQLFSLQLYGACLVKAQGFAAQVPGKNVAELASQQNRGVPVGISFQEALGRLGELARKVEAGEYIRVRINQGGPAA